MRLVRTLKLAFSRHIVKRVRNARQGMRFAATLKLSLSLAVVVITVMATGCPQPAPSPTAPPTVSPSPKPASPTAPPPPPTARPTTPSPSPKPPATPTVKPITPAPKPKPTPEEIKAPEISIESPKELESLPAGDIKISVKVSNFKLVDQLGAANAPGEGHLHYFLDVAPPTTPGRPAVTTTGTYAASGANSYTWRDVKPGGRVFSVALVNNDHTPLTPPVIADVRANVLAPTGPTVRITAPSGRHPAPGDVKVTVEVLNFKLVDKLGQDSVPGEGHLHYYIDVDPPTSRDRPAVTAPGTYAASSATTHTWNNVSAGHHKLAAQLVNNKHTSLTPPAVSVVEIDILAEAPATLTPRPVTPMPAVTTPTPTAAPAGPSVSINVTAQNFTFNPKTITVPPGARVSIVFNNRDLFPHNIAVYDSQDATRVIFRGDVVTGPGTTTYQFTAPSSPGNYFFRCGVHPSRMTGTFQTSSGGY